MYVAGNIDGNNATCRTNRTKFDLCGMLRPSQYDDAVCVNAAVEINVLDYNVAVRRRKLCERGLTLF